MNLLIVDSDRNLVEMLTSWLKTLGHEVNRAYSVEQARIEWEEHKPDLVLIDTDIASSNVLALCQQMRHIHDALVLVITDGKDVQDEIRCLEAGVDDYLRKPFFPGQLLARINAVSRRGRSTLNQRPASIISVGPLRVDSLHHEVCLQGKTFRLTPTESKLLHMLAVNANNVCTHDQIVSHVWGLGNGGDTYLIKAHIHHLRVKIEPDPANPIYLLTVPGIGYTLVRRSVEEQETASAPRVVQAKVSSHAR
ncbi:MAG TPA: response regulator transcription factor [Ktedonobacteraceae bacterium]|nr:response regulator transcription factor [Ktedonobacteraceae bacterium]